MSEVLALGVSHKTAPIELRERLALPDSRAVNFLRELTGDAAVHEAVSISTCNRTELYLVVGDAVEAESAALGMSRAPGGHPPHRASQRVSRVRNCDAARHLFRVTAGLESMIVGESEVQGRSSAPTSWRSSTAPPARSPTACSARRSPRASACDRRRRSPRAACRVLGRRRARRETLGDLAHRHVLILGAGETSELTARALADQGVRHIFVANRRRDRAVSLAQRFGGHSVSFRRPARELERADIVVASTASPHAIVAARSSRP